MRPRSSFGRVSTSANAPYLLRPTLSMVRQQQHLHEVDGSIPSGMWASRSGFLPKCFSTICTRNRVPKVDGSHFSRPRRYEKHLPLVGGSLPSSYFGFGWGVTISRWRYEWQQYLPAAEVCLLVYTSPGSRRSSGCFPGRITSMADGMSTSTASSRSEW